VYPAVSLAPGFSYEQILGGPQVRVSQGAPLDLQNHWGASGIMVLLLLPLLARLWVGLARIASPAIWAESGTGGGPPTLRAMWSAGRGLTLSTMGLWFQVILLSVAAAVLLAVLPAFALSQLVREDTVRMLLLFPLVAFLLFYLLLLNLLFQIALHSLAQNRRGAASALTHAWRIARNDPWATARATLIDFLLYVTVHVIAFVVSFALMMTCIGIPAGVLVLFAAGGFLGVTRACYWARAYRALGGLSPDDQVPGLATESS
jgi:small-conductance mechanosensitive channel